jgi:hypothetical protein
MLDWDRSRDWVVQRCWHDLMRVTVRFRQARPSVAELVAFRRCLPQFRDEAPAALRARIGESGMFALGVMPTPEARRFVEAAEASGLQFVAESASFVSYLPIDRSSGCAWLIEDDTEAAAVALAMLRSGVPIQEIQA